MRKEKGITLIALVVTIIVLLILAGVSISMVVGNNGVINQANEAVEESLKGKAKEELELAWASVEAEYAEERTKNSQLDKINYFTAEGKVKLNKYLVGKGNVKEVSFDENTKEYTVEYESNVNKKTYIIKIDATGNVMAVEGSSNGGQGVDPEAPYGELPTYKEAKKNGDFLAENATFTNPETDNGLTAIVPAGFKIINGIGNDQSVANGLVIQDALGNEFVWIPVTTDLKSSYNEGTYREPQELFSELGDALFDSQDTLDYYYGGDYYNYEEDFKYYEEFAEMVESVNKYDGFYIGRYETTIDSDGNIGSEYNTQVLTAGSILKEGTNYYRWWGLYYAQKNANVRGNGEAVQTAMIYGVLWDKTMDYIRAQKTAGYTTYDVDTETPSWHDSWNGHTGIVNSAQANEGDVALNIWDLESNETERTQEGMRWGYDGICAYSRILRRWKL